MDARRGAGLAERDAGLDPVAGLLAEAVAVRHVAAEDDEELGRPGGRMRANQTALAVTAAAVRTSEGEAASAGEQAHQTSSRRKQSAAWSLTMPTACIQA